MPGAGDTATERTGAMSRQRRSDSAAAAEEELSLNLNLGDTAAPALATMKVTSAQVCA